jgi:spore coat polysaccharide biosynthesis predicted glycosyltransferase SpsG/RimJ/RimL family protein N-acetyltransferase
LRRLVAFRCDGDDRIGAGHASRCLQLARAFEAAGIETVFVGRFAGTAARLLESAGVTPVSPWPGPGGITPEADAAVLDSYEIPFADIEALSAEVPTAALVDGAGAPRATAVLSYHPGASGRLRALQDTRAVQGPDYAPVDPAFVSARRPRGFARALVTLGGRPADAPLLAAVTAALERVGRFEVDAGPGNTEFRERVARADFAVSGAGVTPYELACAGVPAALVCLAENQQAVAADFAEAGLAASAGDGDLLDEALAVLSDEAERESIAAKGTASVDGYGSSRARDALEAAFAGRPPPRVLRYRPARHEDSDLLLGWRNEPDVRAASRATEPVTAEEHARWLSATLADPNRLLFVVEEDGDPAGTVRIDRKGKQAEISVTVTGNRRGAGVGSQAVREVGELVLAALPETEEILAEIRLANTGSRRAFERAGYGSPIPAEEGWTVLRLDSRRLIETRP